MDQELFIKKLENKYPGESYKVIYVGENSSKTTVLKCLSCGRRIEVKTGELFSDKRKHICSKCNYKRADTKRNEEIIKTRLLGKAENIEFYMKDRNGIRHDMVNFVCGRCGRINTKEVANFLRQKYDCGYCEGQKESKDTDSFSAELREKAGYKFTLLSEYINAKTPVRIKCNKCGFIRDVKPRTFLTSCYCPKCDRKSSKGEKIIANFLEKKNIRFIPQMCFSNFNIGIHYFDFYIPEYNLVLEFHGAQHYIFNEYFHKTLEEFSYRQKKDQKKKEAALKNGLNYVSIKYTLIDELDLVLEYIFNPTTISLESSGKCLEIETIQDIG